MSISLMPLELLRGAAVHSSNSEDISFRSFNDTHNFFFSNKNFPHQTKRNIAILAESRSHITDWYVLHKLLLAVLELWTLKINITCHFVNTTSFILQIINCTNGLKLQEGPDFFKPQFLLCFMHTCCFITYAKNYLLQYLNTGNKTISMRMC